MKGVLTNSMSTISLVNANCFEYLQELVDNSVELILVDPPYEVSRNTNFMSGKATGKTADKFKLSMDFGNWDKKFIGLDKLVKESYRILKPGGTLICFYDLWKITTLSNYFKEANFKQLRFIEWLKTNPVPINSKINYLTNSREIAIAGVKMGKATFNSQYDNGIYKEEGELYKFPICHDKGRFHPTQKPTDLLEALILKHSKEDDTVLDFCAGAGSTAVAAYNTGRNFIGCELLKEYFDKTLERFDTLNIEYKK